MMRYLLLSLLFVLPTILQAQTVFSEGKIIYDVFSDGGDQSIGSYTLIIKGNYSKRILNLKNGFANQIIYNGAEGSSATLKTIQGIAYALLLTKAELEEANKQFLGATYSFQPSSTKIAGYATSKGSVKYKNGKKINLTIARDLLIDNPAFLSMFPDIEGLPLEYSMDNGNASMRFLARTIEIRNIDSEEFVIPKNYKIVTKKELEGLR